MAEVDKCHFQKKQNGSVAKGKKQEVINRNCFETETCWQQMVKEMATLCCET